MKRQLRPYLCLLLVSSFLWGCQKDDVETVVNNPVSNYDASMAEAYFNHALKITKETPGYSPPVAARAYGYTGLTLYESVVHGMTGYRSMAGVVNGLNPGMLALPQQGVPYHWALVANNAMAGFMNKMYSSASAENLEKIETLRNQYNMQYIASVTQETYDRSVSFGNTIADQMYAYASSDGQELCYQTNFPSYTPPTGPGMWVPTPPAFQNAMQPYWGAVRTFITANVTATQPPAPIPFSTSTGSLFYSQALEVYSVTQSLTAEQEKIAKFWSDDPVKTATPPGHSISIATQVLNNENASLAKAAEVYAKVGMAVHDAFVSCWKCKFDMNVLRPVTYINDNIDANWSSLLITPPFPEFTSGHSSQTGAVSRILSDIFGYNYSFTDYTHVNRTDIDGSPRHFSSFYEMADEAAISRLYGGIHYREAIEAGIIQGRKIGENISNLPFRY